MQLKWLLLGLWPRARSDVTVRYRMPGTPVPAAPTLKEALEAPPAKD